MRNAIAAYAILIPMILIATFTSGASFANLDAPLKSGLGWIHLVAGSVDLESAKYQESLAEFEQAIKAEPGSAIAYNGLACAYQGLNKHKEAIAACDKSLSLTEEATTTSGKSLELAEEANTHSTRGYSYGQLGDLEAEMRDYDAAIKVDPSVGSSYAYRAQALEKRGDKVGAKRDREKSKALGYHPSAFDQTQLEH